MRPILFQWRRITIPSYLAMLYLGLVAGVVAGNAAAHAAGIDAFRAFVATLVLVACALIGARLLYVMTHWQLYRRDLPRIWHRSEGGAALYGGLLLALPFSVPLLAILHLSWGAFWDVATFTMLVGMIFTRVGCLLNGCCAGRPSSARFSVRLPNQRGEWKRRIPTQCLEAGWAAALLVFAMAVWRWLPFPGALFLLVLTGYALGRLAFESTRELRHGASRFTIHHAISVLLIVVSLVGLTTRWPK
jgi:prolipoprotein diacylglyceryltransferase